MGERITLVFPDLDQFSTHCVGNRTCKKFLQVQGEQALKISKKYRNFAPWNF
jgi:hypothetical protein